MIFAVRDYLNFKNLERRYTERLSDRLMGLAFYYELPASALEEIKIGDSILMGSFDSASSWAVMYYTDSEISHATIYAGNERVLHMATDGVRIEPISHLFSNKVRFLPVRMPHDETAVSDDDIVAGLEKYAEDPRTQHYAFWLVAVKWLLIVSGRNLHFFRWYHAADIFYLLGFIGFSLAVFRGSWTPFLALVVYATILGINKLLWSVWPMDFVGRFGAPISALAVAEAIGGHPLIDVMGWRNWMMKELEGGAFDHLLASSEERHRRS